MIPAVISCIGKEVGVGITSLVNSGPLFVPTEKSTSNSKIFKAKTKYAIAETLRQNIGEIMSKHQVK